MKLRFLIPWICAALFLAACASSADTTPGPVISTVAPAMNENGSPALPSTGGLTTTLPASTQALTATEAPAGATPGGATPEAATPELPEGAVILFQRSGGIAGQTKTWTVYSDGRIVDAAGQETQVTPEILTGLMQAVRAAGFFQMQPQYGIAPVPDAYTYRLTVRDGDQVQTVTTFDGAQEAPVELTGLLQTLQAALGLR